MESTPAEQPLELVLTTEASRERAEALAAFLIEQRLVACASLGEVRSLYHWEGALERSDEVQLLLKTTPDRLQELERAVRDRHSYAVPQWIHWRASAVGSYGHWCAAAVGPLSPDAGASDPAARPGDGDPAG